MTSSSSVNAVMPMIGGLPDLVFSAGSQDQIQDVGSAATGHAPWMRAKPCSVQVGDRDVLTLDCRVVDLFR